MKNLVLELHENSRHAIQTDKHVFWSTRHVRSCRHVKLMPALRGILHHLANLELLNRKPIEQNKFEYTHMFYKKQRSMLSASVS